LVGSLAAFVGEVVAHLAVHAVFAAVEAEEEVAAVELAGGLRAAVDDGTDEFFVMRSPPRRLPVSWC
jgi:hypothetical protein